VRNCDMASLQPLAANPGERQSRPGSALAGDLWMIDHAGSTVLRCRCLGAFATGMRLCVPAGYGVAVGQRYELRGCVPGEHPSAVAPAIVASWVTVVQTQNMTDEDGDRLDVGVLIRSNPRRSAPRPVASRGACLTSGDRAAFRVAGRHWKLHLRLVGPERVTDESHIRKHMMEVLCHKNAPRSRLAGRRSFTISQAQHACAHRRLRVWGAIGNGHTTSLWQGVGSR
jgi:hypothetical protein